MEPVGIITFTVGRAALTPLMNLQMILKELSGEVYLVLTTEVGIDTQNLNPYHVINHKGGGSFLFRLIKVIFLQIKICIAIFSIRKKVNTFFFFMGGEILILPLIMSKLMGKTIFLNLAASHKKMSALNKDNLSLYSSFFLYKINFFLADKIIIYTNSLIEEWELRNYENKVAIASRHFVDLNKFKKIKSFDQKDDLVGYIGRFSPEKGVLNLVHAIPSIISEKKELKFVLIGEGKLKPDIERFIKAQRLENHVKIVNWVDHDKLNYYLNEIKLLILPSHTEGLPNIVLEAMAAGTIILCAPVGSLRDVICNFENGFILKNNSVDSITESVIEVLNYPELDRISNNGIKTINESFTFNKAVNRYKRILSD